MELRATLAVSASTMRAAVTTRYGRPEVVEVREVPTPTPADNEVLVRVRASSVSFGDRIFRSGPLFIRLLSGFRPRHPILGVDLAGTVEAVGPGVTRFAPGDAVYGARGEKFAAHAEFACVAEDGFIARKPATMTFEEAGTVFVGAGCSLYFLRRANVKPGERVLVHGASGSLGVFAVQLAKHFGAHVTAVCSHANVDLVRSLGADDVIDYTAQDFTDGGPVHDVILDVLGKAGFPRSLRALKPGGRYLLVGFSEGLGGIVRALVTGGLVHLSGRARFVTGAADPKQADLVFLQELIDAGKLRTVIGRRYRLDEIAEAHRYADTGHKIGNVAVLIGGPQRDAHGARNERQPEQTRIIKPVDFDDDRVKALLRRHLEGMHANTPPGHVFALDWSGLQRPEISFYALWDDEELLGFGALKELDAASGEVKSMRTADAHLRKGVAATILDHIIAEARKRAYTRISLETGSGAAFEPALALYRRRGFTNGGAFGDYEKSPFNQFLHLDLV